MFSIRIAAGIALACATPLALAAGAPIATTLAPTNVTATSVQLKATVHPNGRTTSVSFDGGLNTSYGSVVAASPSSVSRLAGTTSITATISGALNCGTTYHYRVRATNSLGTSLGSDQAFTTTACSPPPNPVAPTATTGSASAINTTSATLNGNATAGSASATLSFEYGTTTAYGSTRAATPASLAAGSSGAMSAGLSGLACGTTYHYRARATSSVGTANGGNSTFATATCAPPPTPVAPTATTGSASAINTTSATLNGSATAGSASATLSFEYGTTTGYGSTAAATPASLSANGSGAMSAGLSGLVCGTTYHYRARATSSVGTANGANSTFATATCAPPPTPVAPTATTGSASAINTTSATLNGSATAGSASATLSFEYGTTTGYGSTAAATPANLSANGSGAMSAGLSGLVCGTTYHYRARATSSVGTANGGNSTFATATCAPPPPPTSCSNANVHCVSPTAGANQEFATIQAAVNVAVAGDTVLVFDGNYAGFVVSRSGTAAAPITVKANGTGATVVSPSSAGEGIRVNNSSYVTIQGFRVTGISGGMGLAARGATVTTPMHGVVFRDNVVSNSGDNNIYASQVVDSLIEGNVAFGSASNNGIYIANAGSENTTVRGNVVYGNFANGVHMNGDLSVGGDGIITGLVIEENVVYGNGENGLNMDGVQASFFRNNVVYNNARHAIRGYAIDGGGGPRGHTFVNNTLVVNNGNTPIKLTNDLGGHTFFNNVLVNEGTSGGSIVVGTTSGLRSDYNTFVNPGFSLDGGSSMLSITQWRAQAGGNDAASRTATQAELFVAPASRDYRLRAGAVAANAGVATFNGKTAPVEDIAGVARPQGGVYDHGAYESF